MTLTCYTDLETAKLSRVFCTPSHRKEHLGKFSENHSEFRSYGTNRKLKGVNPMTLEVDLDFESADPVQWLCTPSH